MSSGLSSWLGARVDATSIAAFRLALGVVMALESLRLLWPRDGGSTLERVFFDAAVRVPYPALESIVIDEPSLLRAIAAGTGVCGVALAAGVLPRLTAAGVAAGWTIVWLQDATLYNNHHYLMSLLAGLLVFVPGVPPLFARDAWQARPTVAFACVALLRLQLVLPYFYGGVAKCTVTWWEHAEPLRTHLALPATAARLEAWLPDALHAFAQSEAFAHALSRAGLAVDLFAGPLLLWRPTRALAALVLVAFHGANHFLLFDDIGLFPLLGILTLPIFFAPDWPRRVAARFSRDRDEPGAPRRAARRPGALSPLATTACIAFAALQVLLPLRHFAIPGHVDWTGQGRRFAWRMKSHVMHPGRFSVELRDTGVVETTADGRQRVDWSAWPEPEWAAWELREVDPFDSRWPERPPIVAVWHPLVGERLLANPHARSAGNDAASAALPRRPARTREAILREIDRLAPGTGSMDLAARIDAARSRPEARVHAEALREAIDRLARSAAHGDAVRALLRDARPFELEGGPREDGAFAILDAPRVSGPDLAAFPRLAATGAARLAVRGAGAPRLHVGLPRAYVRRALDGRHRVEWNPAAELSPRALSKVRTGPGLLATYLAGVAKRWEDRTGRRPRVRVDAYAALAPWGLQRLVDPDADLASVPWPIREAQWISTLTRSPRNSASQK